MRVVGYVREASGPQEGESAYAQSERIRRWVADAGHQLIAVCQDVRTPGRELGREGFRAVLGIVDAGDADAVIVSDLQALSADKVVQEIMIWDLRSRNTPVVSTDAEEMSDLEDPARDRSRLFLRDVFHRIDEYRTEMGQEAQVGGRVGPLPVGPTVIRVEEEPASYSDVIVELIPPNRSDQKDQVTPAR